VALRLLSTHLTLPPHSIPEFHGASSTRDGAGIRLPDLYGDALRRLRVAPYLNPNDVEAVIVGPDRQAEPPTTAATASNMLSD
jgi:hypothetical protein